MAPRARISNHNFSFLLILGDSFPLFLVRDHFSCKYNYVPRIKAAGRLASSSHASQRASSSFLALFDKEEKSFNIKICHY